MSSMNSLSFANCNLSGMNLTHINLEKAVFDYCKLRGTNFTDSNTTGVTFQNCQINKTILDLEGFIQFGLSKGFILSS